MHSPLLRFASLCALLLVAGCRASPSLPPTPDAGVFDGGVFPSSDAGSSSGDAGLALVNACPTLNRARCDLLVRCGLIEDSEESVSTCIDTYEATWCGPTTWSLHVTAGTVRYDPSRAAVCASELSERACADFASLPKSCTEFLSGRSLINEPCFDGVNGCAEGVCRGATCPRTCQPKGVAEDQCFQDADCRSGLFCRAQPLAPGTKSCAALGVEGTPCAGDSQCVPGLSCHRGVCRLLPLAPEGCLDGLCGTASYCERSTLLCVTRKQLNAPCDGDQCQPALVCESSQRACVRAQLSAGEACSLQQACPQGYACRTVGAGPERVCALLSSEHGSCASDSECQPHLHCAADGDGGQSCEARVAAELSCDADRDCEVSARCSMGRCQTLPTPGEACSPSLGCRWGLCRDMADGGSVCGSLLSVGQTCQSTAQCASGACEGSVCLARCLP